MSATKQTLTAVPSLDFVRGQVAASLDEFFTMQIKRAGQASPSYMQLWREIARLGLHGGKRFRPYLAMLSYYGYGGRTLADIVPIATALELLHLSLLIHDDIIDRDNRRYGQLNVAGAFDKRYARTSPHMTAVERSHYAMSAAILAGDLGISSAYQLIITSSTSADVKKQLINLLSETIYDVMGGELLDTEESFLPRGAKQSLRIAELKTAGYSCVAPLVMGAIAAGASKADVELLEQIGTKLGIAYQLVDDLLGIFGSEAATGKPILSDLREGKRTYLIHVALEQASREQREILQKLLGKPEASIEDLHVVRSIIGDTKARARCEAMIGTYRQEALDLLEHTSMDGDTKTNLAACIDRILSRNA